MHLRKLIHIMTLVILGTVLVACGGATDRPDAIPAPADADNTDADTTPDAAPLRSGTVSLQEIRLNGTTDIQGLSVSIDFSLVPAPALGDGSLNSCTTWEFSAANLPPAPTDEGAVSLTVTDGAPVFPACTFISGDYLCISEAGATAAGDVFTDDIAGPGTAGLTVAAASFSAADIGRYVAISGATTAENNGNFPVLSVAAGPTIIYGNLAAVSEAAVDASTTYTVLAGVGPIPGNADPGLLDDGDSVEVTLAGGANFAGFTTTVEVGNDFSLDAATATFLSNVPTPTTATDVTVTCADCALELPTVTGQVLIIETTNADLTNAGPTDFPAGTESTVTRCLQLGNGAFIVPAEHLQHISDAANNRGHTRVQTTYLFTALDTQGSPPTETNVIAGHGVVGFTDL